MPKLLRLNGLDLVRILEQFGFTVIRIKGSHHILRRTIYMTHPDGQTKEETQTVNVPIHGSHPLAPGMLKRIYRDTCRYIPENELKPYFYGE